MSLSSISHSEFSSEPWKSDISSIQKEIDYLQSCKQDIDRQLEKHNTEIQIHQHESEGIEEEIESLDKMISDLEPDLSENEIKSLREQLTKLKEEDNQISLELKQKENLIKLNKEKEIALQQETTILLKTLENKMRDYISNQGILKYQEEMHKKDQEIISQKQEEIRRMEEYVKSQENILLELEEELDKEKRIANERELELQLCVDEKEKKTRDVQELLEKRNEIEKNDYQKRSENERRSYGERYQDYEERNSQITPFKSGIRTRDFLQEATPSPIKKEEVFSRKSPYN